MWQFSQHSGRRKSLLCQSQAEAAEHHLHGQQLLHHWGQLALQPPLPKPELYWVRGLWPCIQARQSTLRSWIWIPFCSNPFSNPFFPSYSYLHAALKEIPCALAEGWVSHERVCGTHWVTWEKGTSGNAKPSIRRKPHQGSPPVLPRARISTVQVFCSTEGLCSCWRTLQVPTHSILGSGSWRRNAVTFGKGFLTPFLQKSLKTQLKLKMALNASEQFWLTEEEGLLCCSGQGTGSLSHVSPGHLVPQGIPRTRCWPHPTWLDVWMDVVLFVYTLTVSWLTVLLFPFVSFYPEKSYLHLNRGRKPLGKDQESHPRTKQCLGAQHMTNTAWCQHNSTS